jgi:hypothetical protein
MERNGRESDDESSQSGSSDVGHDIKCDSKFLHTVGNRSRT